MKEQLSSFVNLSVWGRLGWSRLERADRLEIPMSPSFRRRPQLRDLLFFAQSWKRHDSSAVR